MSNDSSKIVLITGCSSGFGLQIASRLAAKKYRVIATMRNLNKKAALLEEVKNRGGEVDVLHLNVRDKDSIKDAFTEIGAKYGYIDVLVNNAGYGMGGFFEDLTEQEIRDQMETNFFGVQNVIRAFLPMMRPRRRGKIINISSMSGLTALPCSGAYNASKWALEGFSESLHSELKFFGIDVLLIEPGIYRTKIFYENSQYAKNFYNEESPYCQLSKQFEKKKRALVDDCHKDVEDIAALVEKLIESVNPPFRNIPDIESRIHYCVRKILPFRLYSALVRKAIFNGLRPPKH